MLIKRLLIFIPLLLIIFLLQSFFWVPTYEEQTKGNPKRLKQFITASIGDASILNPILSSDSASSEIESKVFEGLLDRDKDLSLRGRLAKDWNVYEQAYFYLPDQNLTAPLQNPLKLINQARHNLKDYPSRVHNSLKNIEKIELLPEENSKLKKKINSEEKPINLKINAPRRIKLTLKEMDPELFNSLQAILGKNYFAKFKPVRHIQTQKTLPKEKLNKLAQRLLPAKEHNPVLLFHLRPGVRFHDGHVFDAHDVKFTYESIVNPKNLSPRIADFEMIKDVEVVDKLTVKVIYSRLYSPALSTWTMGILPEHLLNREALKKEAQNRGQNPKGFTLRDSKFNRHPIGCGPFKFHNWESDQLILLKRFDDYWEGAPNYKEYVFRVIPDLLTQEMEFYSGTLDTYSVQPHQVGRLKNDPRFQCFSGASYGYTYIGYNLRREPFKDPKVRRALSLAIDVDKIIKYVLYGQAERITGPFVKQTKYYNDQIKPVEYNPQKALKLLKAAGYTKNSQGWLEKNGKPLQFTLITNTGNDIRKAILAIVQNAWKEIGVDVQTDTLEWSVFIQERVNKLDFDALILGWVMSLEPDLYQIWHSSQADPFELNFVGFKNQKADQLILKIRKEYDKQKQVEYCHKLHRIIAREQPYTFLYVGKWTAVLDKRIVIKEKGKNGRPQYSKIQPTKTGDYTFYFNKWVKLPEAPRFAMEN